MYSQLSKCSTARGAISGLSINGPTEVKTHKSFLFSEGSLKMKIKNTCLILLLHYIGGMVHTLEDGTN